MKFIGSYVFRSMCALLIGLLLIVKANEMPVVLVMLIGALFMLPGLISVFVYIYGLLNRNAVVRPSFPLMSIGSIFLGGYLMSFPESFVTYLVILIGIILILAGISQLSAMVANRRVTPFSWLLMLIPVVLIGVGVFSVMYSRDAAALPFKIIGFTLLYYGITDLFLALRTRHYSSLYAKQQAKKEEEERRRREAEYVEFEIVNTNENNEE